MLTETWATAIVRGRQSHASVARNRLTLLPPEPAVAGRNAQQEHPQYYNWAQIHHRPGPPGPPTPTTWRRPSTQAAEPAEGFETLRATTIGPSDRRPLHGGTNMAMENRLLHGAVNDLTKVISTLMHDRGSLIREHAVGIEALLKETLTLAQADQSRFQQPLARMANAMCQIAVQGEEARTAMDDVRKRLVEAGLGGLLSAWDQGTR
ncbi:MAG: hypothetical protein Q9219_007212 [cf. Caloplaca sp. 3 TL-2023]